MEEERPENAENKKGQMRRNEKKREQRGRNITRKRVR